jgi:hypothetical protein
VFWLHSRRRETNLHQRLIEEDIRHPVATGIHADHPASASLRVHGGRPEHRVPLIDLPPAGTR